LYPNFLIVIKAFKKAVELKRVALNYENQDEVELRDGRHK